MTTQNTETIILTEASQINKIDGVISSPMEFSIIHNKEDILIEKNVKNRVNKFITQPKSDKKPKEKKKIPSSLPPMNKIIPKNKNNLERSIEAGTRLFNLSKNKKPQKQNIQPLHKPPVKEETTKVKIKVETMLDRFKANQEITLRKIEDLKKRLNAEEMSNIRQRPEINRSRSAKFQENFLQRVESYKNNSQAKKTKLIEEENKRRYEDYYQIPRKHKKIDKDEIDNNINNMLEWENQRQEKIRLKQNETYFKQVDGCTFTPRINDHSKIIAQAQNELFGTLNVSDRLYLKSYLNNGTNQDKDKDNGYTTLKRNKIDANNYINMVTNQNNNLLTNQTAEVLKTSDNLGEGDKSKTYVTNTTNDTSTVLNVNGQLFEKISKKEEKIIESLIRKRVEKKDNF